MAITMVFNTAGMYRGFRKATGETGVFLYGDDARFRSTVDMEQHRYGRGRYRYFAHPLPPPVAQLRTHLYRHLAPIANRWNERLGREERYPATLDAFLAHCHARGQERPARMAP